MFLFDPGTDAGQVQIIVDLLEKKIADVKRALETGFDPLVGVVRDQHFFIRILFFFIERL